MRPYYEDGSVKIFHGDVLSILPILPAESVHCVITSPPYWGLRDYGTAQWEGGDEGCDHKGNPLCSNKSGLNGYTSDNIKLRTFTQPFKGVCGKCGARRIDSQLGLEATPEEYVAKELGRKGIGIELKSEYIDLASARMAQEVLDLCR